MQNKSRSPWEQWSDLHTDGRMSEARGLVRKVSPSISPTVLFSDGGVCCLSLSIHPPSLWILARYNPDVLYFDSNIIKKKKNSIIIMDVSKILSNNYNYRLSIRRARSRPEKDWPGPASGANKVSPPFAPFPESLLQKNIREGFPPYIGYGGPVCSDHSLQRFPRSHDSLASVPGTYLKCVYLICKVFYLFIF